MHILMHACSATPFVMMHCLGEIAAKDTGPCASHLLCRVTFEQLISTLSSEGLPSDQRAESEGSVAESASCDRDLSCKFRIAKSGQQC